MVDATTSTSRTNGTVGGGTMFGRRTWAVLAATAVTATFGTVLAVVPAGPARAAGECGSDEVKPGETIKDIPWQQKWLDPEQVWPFATGVGQTVAVIDTGVDGTHPQLKGRVQPGFDVLRNAADNNVDCTAHGTAVASLIAGQKADDVGFHGLAPDAQIMPI